MSEQDEPTSGFPAQQQTLPGRTDAMDPPPDHGEHSYRGCGRLEGIRALITGGDSGIGRAVAIAFAREGADVALSYLPEEQGDAEETASWVRETGRTAALCPGDLTEQHTCEEVAGKAVQELGGLDVLINNAGVQMARDDGLEDMSVERIDRVLKTNLYALLWLTQAVLPHLHKGSSIINVSSIQAYQPSTSLLDYAATKAGINNLTVNLAAELGPKGIRVNAVAPGPIWTPLQPATQRPEKLESFGTDTPLGRAGQPAEVAPAFVYLASPREAGYVSGTVVGVTGGKPVF
ncbi:SDR family oxidoreductase [Luteipulveratus sp. YIM 133132]|uniref:SDR family oxidoreductase n=1 Tax=Luteipulveratus flavus TaxID=3031728 RepID=A0ABT6CBN6_9MICO|nr:MULTISPECIES: SDR family oxidoreductase [unclassified Luteipulveratus]MDE9365647.1 SDR family oxidoreductase [Luteipulveratus sp. YIM 133132]MDF8266315.1 SDR family oxidoreductase [Luteipulveratus sp. YIM 133296]